MSLEAPFFSFDREINKSWNFFLWSFKNSSGVPPWICRFHIWRVASVACTVWKFSSDKDSKSSFFLSLKNDNSTSKVDFINLFLKKQQQSFSSREVDVDQQVNLFHAALWAAHSILSSQNFRSWYIFSRTWNLRYSSKFITKRHDECISLNQPTFVLCVHSKIS